MVAPVIPVPNFRGYTRAYTTATLAITASIALSRTTAYVIDNSSGNSVGVLAYIDGFNATSLTSSTWLRDRGGSAMDAAIIDCDITWVIQRSTDGGESWSTYDAGNSYTRPVTLELPNGTQLTDADPSTDQRGFGCQLVAYHTGMYRFVATLKVRDDAGGTQSVTVTSSAVTISAFPTVYHIDPNAGSDAADGLSPSTPWASFANAPSEMTDHAIAIKRGETLTLSARQQFTDCSNYCFGAYGSGDKPVIAADGAFNTSHGLIYANLNGVDDDVLGFTACQIRFDCNRRATAGVQTVSSTTLSDISGLDIHDCEFANTRSSGYGVLLSFGGSDNRKHENVSMWGLDFEDPTATYKWKQSIYIQGTSVCAIGNCTFDGQHANTVLDHSIYVNVPDHFWAYWLNGVPSGTPVGSAVRGGLVNISIGHAAGLVPDTNGLRYINVYECDGTDSTNCIDISEAGFDPFDTSIAAKPTQVKYFDLVSFDAIYQKGGNNVILAKNVRRCRINDVVGDQCAKATINYGVQESAWDGSGADYDTLPRFRLGTNHAYRCGNGVLSWDPRAADGAVIDADETQWIESNDTAGDRKTGIGDLNYLTSDEHIAAGGGIGAWSWIRSGTGDTIQWNDHRLADPTDLSLDDDIATPTGNADDTLRDEAALSGFVDGFDFGASSPYDAPASRDFSGDTNFELMASSVSKAGSDITFSFSSSTQVAAINVTYSYTPSGSSLSQKTTLRANAFTETGSGPYTYSYTVEDAEPGTHAFVVNIPSGYVQGGIEVFTVSRSRDRSRMR